MGIMPAFVYVISLVLGVGIWLLSWRRVHSSQGKEWSRQKISTVMFAIALVLIVVFSILDDVVLSYLM